jgi:hypothetical protein
MLFLSLFSLNEMTYQDQIERFTDKMWKEKSFHVDDFLKTDKTLRCFGSNSHNFMVLWLVFGAKKFLLLVK